MRSYVRKEGRSLDALKATVFMDNHRDAKNAYNLSRTPTFLVLDRMNSFEVVYKHIGVMSQRELRNFLSVIN